MPIPIDDQIVYDLAKPATIKLHGEHGAAALVIARDTAHFARLPVEAKRLAGGGPFIATADAMRVCDKVLKMCRNDPNAKPYVDALKMMEESHPFIVVVFHSRAHGDEVKCIGVDCACGAH